MQVNMFIIDFTVKTVTIDNMIKAIQIKKTILFDL